MKKQNLFLFLLLFLGNMILYAQCSVNAGGNATICGTSYTLQGSSSGSTGGPPVWTLVSKPSGAPDPVISNVNSLTPNVTGMTAPGNYVFQVAQNCSPSGSASSQVTITAPGDVATFTAGTDITDVPATTGTVTLNGIVPAGYTASWSAYNIYRWQRSSIKNMQNAMFSSTTSATTTFSLIKKADHDIDPAYLVTLRITSTLNPNCWYEKSITVRFIPNPQIVPALSSSRCVSSSGGSSHFVSLQSTSPIFSQGYSSTPGSSGNFGTTITMAVNSQPAGGNIVYSDIHDGNIYLGGITVPGVYKFTLTVSNAAGSYTTPEITYTFNGIQPNYPSFLVASRPEQMMIYDSGDSGGEVHCNFAGQTTPITFLFTLNPSDPTSLITKTTNKGTTPPGGVPSIVDAGAGTANRSAIITPPAGGWRVGTYAFTVSTSNGTCNASQSYYIHISDGNRSNVTVPNTTVCYPGSGIVTATIPLPAVYKGVPNSSYLQDFDGRYRLTLVSKPSGAANPTFEPYANTLFTNASTTISNLDTQGEYVFKIKADTYVPTVGAFLDKEYACSGASLEGTFSVFVSGQVGANAGSAQTLIGTSQTTFNGNNPGVATGAWTLLSKPSGATDPVIVTPSAYNTNVTGFNTPGVYTFRWTVTTGNCASTSDLTVTVAAPAPGGVTAAVWYKADAGVYSNAGTTAAADNTAVQQWNDQMGTGYHLVQATAAQKPTFSNQTTLANFNPTVTFISAGHGVGQGGFMTADPGTGNAIINRAQGSIYIAGKMTTLGAAGLAGFDQTMDYPGLHISNNATTDKLLFYTAGSGYTTLSTNLFAARRPFVAGSSWLNAAGSTAAYTLAKAWLDGNESVYNNTDINVNTTDNATTRVFRIGRDTNWGSHDGQMNEAIVFANPLSASEKARVDSYLSVKWGSTLLGDYVNSTSGIIWNYTATYQNNILGIARDNLSTLYQKQSRSENPNQQLIIGAGSLLANTNAANAGTLTDGQFLLAGDNGLKQALNTPLAYTAGSNGVTNYRFESIWKVQNTNSIGTVTVAWPKGVNNLYLVQSADETFDGTDTFSPMVTEVTVNGVVYNTANVTLANGQYFTFAGYLNAPGGVVSSLWYRADKNLTPVNGAVTSWKDYSAGAITITPNLATTTSAPTATNGTGLNLNFNPGVTFVPANALGNSSVLNAVSSTNYSIYTSTTPVTGSGYDRVVGLNYSALAGGNKYDSPGIAAVNINMRDNAAGSHINAAVTPVAAQYAQLSNTTIVRNSFTSNQFQRALNGAAAISTMTMAPALTTWPDGGFLLGRNANDGGDDNGTGMTMSETIVFDKALTANEINRVDSYLAIKGGITLDMTSTPNYLSSNSLSVWTSGNNTGYNNNIFGIANDKVSDLNQMQSNSINPGQKLIIGAGSSLANTNAANTNTLTDGQFLMTGDNGLKQSLTVPLSYTAGSNGVVNFRFESIWKAQNTNSIGTVTVAWPKELANLYLVQSSDAVFDGTDTFTPMTTEVTVNGVVYNTANVTLANGQYFTFAGFAQGPGGVIDVDFWVKSDDAGTISTAWKDNSINADNIPNVGGVTLSAADRNHNFYPYTTGYTSGKYFHNNTSKMNPLGNVEFPNINTSIFSAVRPTTLAAGRIIGIDNDTANAAEPGVSITSAGNPRQYEFWNTTTSSDFSTPFNIGQSNVFSALANNTVANGGTSAIAGGEKRLGLNGSYQAFSGFAAANKFQIYGTNLRLGYATWDVSGAFPGDVMEVAWYNRTLTANEQSRVNTYLAIKNGVTAAEDYLASNNSTVWNITTNTGYNNNIFGLARDNSSALHQKQAASTAAGQQLVIGNGTSLFDSNIANTNSLTEMQFLMTGDNGLKQSLTTPLSYTAGSNGATNFRFESIWKTQNSGNVGSVTVAWPKGVKNLYLVQSSDAVFDGVDTFTPMTTEVTVNGVVYNTANVTLANGQFFTFAGFGLAPGGVVNSLSYWYRADKNAVNTGAGTDVTAWTDMWNGTTVAQKVSNALPKYAQGAANYFNFNPGINFTAITQTLGNTDVQSVTNTSNDIFTVTKEGMTAPSSPNPHFLSIGMDNVNTTISNWDYMGMYPTTNVIERRVVNGGTQMVNSNLLYSSTIPSIMYNTFSNTTLSRGLNGAANAATATYSAVGLALGGHIFGDTRWTGNNSDNGGFIGNLGETIIYGSGNLTATERRKVDSYLAIKYGITLGRVNTDHYLATDETIVWNGTTNTAYNNNIFGVTRDDIEAFEQKVSKSVNAGTVLTVATINDFASPNQTAARTGFANDKTYFLLGDNNITATPLVNLTVAGNTMKRIQRAWLSQRLNNTGALYFEADLSAYGATFTAGNSIQMIVADDAAFTTNVKLVPGVFTGGKWVFADDFNPDNVLRYITFVEGKTYCYKPGATATAGNPALPTKVGITSIGRAGAGNTDNWPMVRKGGWMALEAKTKGFVPNKVKFNVANQPVAADGVTPVITIPVEGMLLYDTTNKCMKIYTQKEGDASSAWHCITTQTCPD
ncbi:hypothetical protein [Chryseobacterium lactis]|uniref:beta strand repeat-containing protein n=2 Tax=Pseudomonadati TaxID=3379134 RepID=UPI00162AD590|nr:hypothetical protein [Chryseobacterium lactis]